MVFLGVLWGAFSGASSVNVPSHFEVHGHRGARATRPENTLPAFQHALEVGATALELDMGITRDQEVVLNHDLSVDTDLCKSSDRQLAKLQNPLVNSLTLKQIKTYDCGSIRNSDFPNQVLVPGAKVLTLRELVRFLKFNPLPQSKFIKLNMETKLDIERPEATVSPEVFVDLVEEVIRSEGFDSRRVLLQSFDFRSIVYAKQKWPNLKTAALISKLEGSGSVAQKVQKIFDQTQADYLSPNGRACNKDMVQAAHALNKKVLVWTINKKKDWRHFIRMGVDGIITDDPAALMLDVASSRKR